MFSYTQQNLPFAKDALDGISQKTLDVHYDKLYVGYVNKVKEIEEKLQNVDFASANQTYSAYRAIKSGEPFARNGVTLHESYFASLGGNGAIDTNLPLVQQIIKDFGSVDLFKEHLVASGMSARGWAVTAWDFNDKKLHIYTCDAHHQGGIWGAMPVLTLDVYEHAYFMDYGSDRKAYIEAFWNNINWESCNALFEKLQ